MKCTFIQNGKLSLALTPETEIEKLLLQNLFSAPVTTQLHDKLQILDKSIADTVVISPQRKEES